MLRRVKIKVVPKARTGYQVRGALANDVPAFGGADYNAYIGQPNTKISRTISAVPRKEANLEAEGGETVVGNLDGSNIPSFKKIVGPRHYAGGVPLNLPDDSFIFSDTKGMKISDPNILKIFNKPAKKGGYTPAELSKKFDINKYRQILQDPNSDKIDIKTAELMIKTCVLKLGALALAQESKKGFPQGIPKIAEPYMEANGIAEEDLIPKKPEEQEEMPKQEMGESSEMQGQQEMPMQMPNGEPVAMPQQGMQQMGQPEMYPQQMQQAPMAMYGMSMGGYDMPYASDPYEMAYGGSLPKAKDGVPVGPGPGDVITGQKRRPLTADELRTGIPTNVTVGKRSGDDWQDLGKGIYGRGDVEGKEWVNKPGGGGKFKGSLDAYIDAICNRMKNGNLKGYTLDQVINEAKVISTKHSQFEELKAKLAPCVTIDQKSEYIREEEGPKDGPCQCEKEFLADGKTPDPTYKPKDSTGRCTCTPEDTCECKDPETGEIYDPGKDVEGNCNECTKDYPGIIPPPPRNPPEWWLQDTVNTMGAVGDLASVKKYMPWEARVDLEEPRPTFLDPTRELAAQSEQANIASQANATFAGPQGLGARNAATQGQGAAAAANTLSKINNQNVNIGNQFEATQVGVRNQESLLNQQMGNRVYDKNVVANQQFDNAKRQGRANVRESYNTALTNRAKTDAMNQLYPNYQVSPRTGGLVNYTPTEKKVSPGANEMTPEEYAQSISKYDPKVQQKLMDIKFGKYGGQLFEHGGYVYSTFPII